MADTLKYLTDLNASHQNVSISFGMALQHLADSLFVQLGNFIPMHRDSYLDHVVPGMKLDTGNELRNVLLFGYGLMQLSMWLNRTLTNLKARMYQLRMYQLSAQGGPQHSSETIAI